MTELEAYERILQMSALKDEAFACSRCYWSEEESRLFFCKTHAVVAHRLATEEL